MKPVSKDVKILVCVGTGGVGKTTLAAAFGAWAAEQGRDTLVLTIDPAQRLKTTLGLSDEGEILDLKHPRFKGRFAAAVLNPKRTFDEFVLRASNQSEKAKRILNNKLYVQLSTTLNGSQEFTALERLTSAVDSNEFDLIILDTPPSHHAMDFLRAPQKLAALFHEGVAKWLREPEGGSKGMLSGLFQMGTKQVMKALELLTGADFMRELTDFFSSIQGWQGKLHERTQKVQRLLSDPSTHFYLVSSYDRAKLIEAVRFGEEIRDGGSNLSTMLLNRAFPIWYRGGSEKKPASEGAARLAKAWEGYFEKRRKETTAVAKMKKAGVEVHEIPEMDEDIRDLEGVFRLVDVLKEIP